VHRFEVALSFAGDNKRDKVRRVAELLRDRLGDGRVFFDEWFEHELAGHDAQVVLQAIYERSTWMVVTCVCRRYAEKPWTQDEWRAIQAFERTLRDAGGENVKRLRFLPLRFGDGEPDGLFRTAIVPDMRERPPEDIADLILRRLESSRPGAPRPAPGKPAAPAPAPTEAAGSAPAGPPLPHQQRKSEGPKTTAVFGGGNAPIAPPLLYGREADLRALRDSLLTSYAPSNIHIVAAIHGWPGVGRTVLAATLAQDRAISERYPDGVLWATVGERPDCREILGQWALARNLSHSRAIDAGSLAMLLRQELSNCRILVVLDDVWDHQVIQALLVGGSRAGTLITTRSPKLGQTFASAPANIHHLGVLSEGPSLALLGSLAPSAVERFPELSGELVSTLEHLPLAIKVAGHLLQSQATLEPGYDLTSLFADLRRQQAVLDAAPPSDMPHPAQMVSTTVAALFVTSIARLPKEVRAQFELLTVLPVSPAVFSRHHAAVTMNVRGEKLERTLTALHDAGLIEPVVDSRFWIHAMIVAASNWMAGNGCSD